MNLRNRTWLFVVVLQLGAISAALATQTQVADPVLSVAQGTSSSNVKVTVNDTSGTTIYYTTNGTNPTTGSSNISPGGTITVNLSTTLKVQAYQGSNNPSDVITVTYTANGVISSSNGHTVVLKSDGSAWAWGNNASSQLGLGNNGLTTLPSLISKDATQSNFTNVAPIVGLKTSNIAYENGLSIPYEIQYYGATGQNPSSVPNANGLTLLQDSQQGNDPNNYYSQGGKIIAPTITLFSGGSQSGAAGAVLPKPLIISVTKPGGANLTSAPITFSVPTGQGQLSTSSSGTSPSNSVNVTTGSNGRAQIYVILPSSGNTSTITATAPTTGVSAQFIEVVQNFPSGLTAWFRGDTAVPGTGGVVSTWQDSSGNSNDVTQSTSGDQPTVTTDPVSGLQVLQFNGSQWLSNFNDFTSLSNITIITVASADSPGSSQEGLIEIGRGYGTTSAFGYGYDGSNQGFVNGWPSPNYFINWNDGGPIASTTAFTVSTVTYSNSSTTASFFKDGSANGTVSVTVSAQNPRNALSIGSLADYYAAEGWTGKIAEVLVFNNALGTTARQQVELYLANKYYTYAPGAAWISSYTSAVQTQINQNHWSKVQADQYVQLLQTLPVGPGLTAWFKADSSFVPNNGGITTWHDSSGNLNDVSQTDSGSQPTLATDVVSGQPVVNFNGSQYLTGSNTAVLAGVNDVTIITVASDSSTTTTESLVTIGSGVGASNGSRIYGVDGSGSQSFSNGTTAAGLGGPAIIGSALNVSAVTYSQSASTASFYSKGLANPPTATVTTTTTLNAGLTLGSPLYYTAYQAWTGNVAEVLIYNRVLTQTELQQTELYLVNKYNLSFAQPAPTITPNGGTASSSINVTLSAAQSPIVVRYTLDGTTPTSASSLYSGSLTLTQSDPLTCAFFFNNTIISPTSTAQFYVGDTGSIGISDAWQTFYFGHTGINPNALAPGGSGLTNLQSYLWGYNPNLYSTNGDGLSDLENHILGYSATDTDINNYGLTNAQQLALGLDPFSTGINPPQAPSPPSNNNTPLTITLFNPQGATLVP